MENNIVITFPKAIVFSIIIALIGWAFGLAALVYSITESNRMRVDAEAEAAAMVGRLAIASYVRGATDIALSSGMKRWRTDREIEELIRRTANANLNHSNMRIILHVSTNSISRVIEMEIERITGQKF